MLYTNNIVEKNNYSCMVKRIAFVFVLVLSKFYWHCFCSCSGLIYHRQLLFIWLAPNYSLQEITWFVKKALFYTLSLISVFLCISSRMASLPNFHDLESSVSYTLLIDMRHSIQIYGINVWKIIMKEIELSNKIQPKELTPSTNAWNRAILKLPVCPS